MPLTPTYESVDARGYRYVETSEEWMAACRTLPCFPQLWWPDYATKVIEDTIDGKPVVIQLWKGWCQQFLNLKNMPGGVGGEVGVYTRMPGRHIAESIPDLPDPFVAKIREKVAGLGDKDLWWPYPESELQTTIDFEFINPQTGETVFRADPKRTYWRTCWMDLSSYRNYVDAQPGVWPFNKQAPALAWDYALKYTINGRTYPVWADHN